MPNEKCSRCGRVNAIVNQCRCDPHNLPTGPATARIWVFVHNAPDKISVRIGKPLAHFFRHRTDEGWSSEENV